jgi:hypothetical protein
VKLNNKQPIQIIEWEPSVKQAIALQLYDIRYLYYGGAKGGGKSIYLLMDYIYELQYRSPQVWNGLIIRQSLKELNGLIGVSRMYYPQYGGVYNSSTKTWTFPSLHPFASLRFDIVERLEDCTKYQGNPFDWMGFDEIGNFESSEIFDILCLEVRGNLFANRRIRCTGNPKAFWVRDRFIGEHKEGGVITETGDIGLDGKRYKQCFIRAYVTDNPKLLEASPGYIAGLNNLPKAQRDPYLLGEYDKGDNIFFSSFGRQHILPSLPFFDFNGDDIFPEDWDRVVGADWGTHSPYSFVFLAFAKTDFKLYDRETGENVIHIKAGDIVVYKEIYGQGEKYNRGTGESVYQVGMRLKESMGKKEKNIDIYCDTQMWNDSGLGYNLSVGSELQKIMMNDGHLNNLMRANKAVEPRLQFMHGLLHTGKIHFLDKCKNVIEELQNLKVCQRNVDRIADGQKNHAADSLGYGLMTRYTEALNFAVQVDKITNKYAYEQ